MDDRTREEARWSAVALALVLPLIGCSAGAEGSRLEAGVDEQQEGHEGFDGAMGGGGSGPPE
ncbi:MAG: hypothetical protein JRI23_11580, partial [Deltaproteobacteria bacterium]|nr:hypothetical protein [Deltaproteobacteria bacterium]MBW2532339.1 hypothetical protein [Deltaproteobacteria bacterium]